MVTGYTHNPISFCAILHCSLEAREIKIAQFCFAFFDFKYGSNCFLFDNNLEPTVFALVSRCRTANVENTISFEFSKLVVVDSFNMGINLFSVYRLPLQCCTVCGCEKNT